MNNSQALGSTADLGSTRGLFSDITAAREDIDNQIADLKERKKSPFAPRTFIENKIKELQKQKAALDPTGQVAPGVRDDRRPDALDAFYYNREQDTVRRLFLLEMKDKQIQVFLVYLE